MNKYDLSNEKLKIEGIYDFENHKTFCRYPEYILKAQPRLYEVCKKCAGVRLRFRTDSKKIGVELHLANQCIDVGMSYVQVNTAFAFVGPYTSSKYVSMATGKEAYKDNIIRSEFSNDGMNDITVFFPQLPSVEDVFIYLEDNSSLESPTPHKIELPFVFYGSSITQQGHASAFVSYTSLLSRFFDADLYNFGASGNAQGEPEMAEYLGKINKSIFFYDYDHNAPTIEHLKNTHESFFRRFREFDPDTPVIMTSRPADDTPQTAERVEIVRATYENALQGGDKNVYFVDGRTLFGDVDPSLCTTDRTHPNALGHYMMAKSLEKLIHEEKILL